MRSDYALYIVAIICFIITAYTATVTAELYIYAIAVLGIVFLGLGYMARPKRMAIAPAKPVPEPTPELVIEPVPPAPVPAIEPASEPTPQPKAEATEEETASTAPAKTTRSTTRRRRKKT